MRIKTLTYKQQIFVIEYLMHRNATKAARAAVYSKKTAPSIGSENLTKPYILSEIKGGLRIQIFILNISTDHVLQSLREIVFGENPNLIFRDIQRPVLGLCSH